MKFDDNTQRRQAAKLLAGLPGALLQVDPSRRLLTTRWLPLMRHQLKETAQWAREPSALGAGYLAEALLRQDPSGQSLNELWKPLFEEARSHAPDIMGQSLGRMARATRFAHDPAAILERYILPLFERALPQGGQWGGYAEGAAHSLSDLGWAVVVADPSGRLFTQWKELRHRALLVRSNTMPASCGSALQGPMEALIEHPVRRAQLLPELLALYDASIQKGNLRETRAAAFKTIPTLARLLLLNDPSKAQFKTVWTRLQGKMRVYGKDNATSILQTISEVAVVLRDFDPTDGSVQQIWVRRYQRLLHAPLSFRNYTLGRNLEALAPAMAIPGEGGRLPLSLIADHYGAILHTTAESEAGAALAPLAAALLHEDPTGRSFQEVWIPLFKEALRQSSSRDTIFSAMSKVAPLLWACDPSGALLRNAWQPLLESSILVSAINATGRSEDPQEFSRFFARHPLGAPELTAPPAREAFAKFAERWNKSPETASIPAMQQLIPLLLPHLGKSEITEGKLSDALRAVVAIAEKIGRTGTAADIAATEKLLMDALDATAGQPDREGYRQDLLFAFGRLTLGSPQGKKRFEAFVSAFVLNGERATWFAPNLQGIGHSLSNDARMDRLREKLPTLAAIVHDPQKTVRLMLVLSVLRHLYPYDSPAYAEGWIIALGICAPHRDGNFLGRIKNRQSQRIVSTAHLLRGRPAQP